MKNMLAIKLQLILMFILVLFTFSFATAQTKYWTKSTALKKNESISLEKLNKSYYEIFNFDIQNFKAALSDTPLRTAATTPSNSIISFPDTDGHLQEFEVVETVIFSSDDNKEHHPHIKTYLGFSTDGLGTRARFSVTPLGLKVMISSPGKDVLFIQPVNKVSNGQYIVYNRKSRPFSDSNTFECLTEDIESKDRYLQNATRDANDQSLRVFRMAMSVTSEYSDFWDDGDDSNGDEKADALAQMISTLNRVNEILEVDLAISFVLVDTNDDPALDLIYEGTDPYTTFTDDLQSNLTAVVGEEDYDIGHLLAFSSNFGLSNCLGCICVDEQKGSAFSSHQFKDNDGGPFMADFFDIDYVAHEIGHQLGANHTFSNASEGLGVNVEPGSGSTIMAYPGISDADDVQDHADPYYHFVSINQILKTLDDSASSCAQIVTITNNPPVANAGLDYTIPAGTAFVLKGSATDADTADVLTYCWEQIDDGVTTNTNFSPTKTTGALWRSRLPSVLPNRYMPNLSRVLNGQLTETNPVETIDNTSWETVSTVSRVLNFSLTVRDRAAANGLGQTPQNSSDQMTVTVDDVAGPFVVTSQSTNVTWDVNSDQIITWDVANTDIGMVNTPTVNIRLSVDGGMTFPFTLAENVPNNGNQTITVPEVGGDFENTARVLVEGNNNIFYAVNSTNFSIQESEFILNIIETDLNVCQPNDAVFNFTYNTFLGFTGVTTLSLTGLPAGLSSVINPTSVTADGTTGTITISGTDLIDLDSYFFSIEGNSGELSSTDDAILSISSDVIEVTPLISPANNAAAILAGTDLEWATNLNINNYFVEVATDVDFTQIVESANVQDNIYTTTALLNNGTTYFWRVTGSNACNTIGAVSEIFSFQTQVISCENIFTALDTPIEILSGVPDDEAYQSILTISENSIITDVNVKVNIAHTWAGDLELFLISPSGTEVTLARDNGLDFEANYENTVFDQEADISINLGSPPFNGSFIPEGDLSILYGETAAGNWTLVVVDDFGNLDEGTLLEFTLDFCFESTLSTEDIVNNFSDLNLYPNPTEGILNISFNSQSNKDVDLIVYDVRGRKVISQSLKNESSRFNQMVDLTYVESGMYLVKISNADFTVTKRIVIN